MPDVALSSARQPTCSWTEATRNFAIHIQPDVIGRLRTECLAALKRVPRRGLEIGGILLGRTETVEYTTTFWIQDFQPVESEHRWGPSYVLSDSDFAVLRTALAKNGAACLGVYRSQTRSGQIAIENSDIELFDKSFCAGDALFLMVAPLSGTGGFFYRTDAKFNCVHEFNLRSSLASLARRQGLPSPEIGDHPPSAQTSLVLSTRLDIVGADKALSISASRPEPSAQVAPLSSELEPENILPKNIRRRPIGFLQRPMGRSSALKKGMLVLAAVAVLALAVGVASNSFRRVLPEKQPPQYLQLTVERAGPSLRLLWDRNAPILHSSTRAVLHIRDGNEQSDRALATSELRAGVMTYQPKSTEVTFRLDVYSTEPNAIGSIQVLFPDAPAAEIQDPPKPVEPAKPVPVKTAPTTKSSGFARSALTIDKIKLPPAISKQPETEFLKKREPAVPVRSDNSRRPSLIADRAVSDRRGADVPAPERPALNRPSVVDRPDVSEPQAKPSVREPDISASVRIPPAEEPAASKSEPTYSVRVWAEPLDGSKLGHIVGKVPILRRLRKEGKSVPPSPVYQAQPVTNASDVEGLLRPLTIDVKVSLTESGAITHAEVEEYGTPPNFTLANAALAAAQKWTFAPARADGISVGSEMLLHFYFSP
jgi:hypothetical protein